MARKNTGNGADSSTAPARPLMNKVAGAVAGRAGQIVSGVGSSIADVTGAVIGMIDRAPKRGRYDRSVSAAERAHATRRRLLQAAAKVFAEKGYTEASVADIIAEAGTSRQTYYDLFDNKEAILLALQQRAVRFMIPYVSGAMDKASTAEVMIDNGVSALLKLVEQAGPLAEIALREMGNSPAVISAREEIIGLFCEMLKEAAEAAYRDGLTTRKPDPVTIRALVGGIETVALDYIRAGRTKEIMETKPAFVRLLERALT
ncbi:MAG: TetR/AcrR family transcriptional regulator [Deltaproteobacteria bacterium]|nr:TetR/AcrR family transcriptional regulator [Deltaproteobacteria bacterium]